MSNKINQKPIKMNIFFSIILIISIIFSYIESTLPFQIFGIGFKIGFSNIAIIIAMFTLSYFDALLIGILRVFVLSFLFSNLIYFELSLVGFLLSYVIMVFFVIIFRLKIVKKDAIFTKKLIIVSILGAIFHNLGQVIVCYFIFNRLLLIFRLLFILLPVGIVSGFIVGYLSNIILIKFLFKYYYFSN